MLTAVLLAHAGLLTALWHAPEPAAPIEPPRLLTVSLIQTEAKPAPEPVVKPEPPKPAPQPLAKPLPPPPVLTANPTPAAASAPVVQPPAPNPDPVPEVLPPPPPPVIAAAPAPKPAAPAAPTAPPRAADYLTNPKPPYPALSKRLGEEGMVRLKVRVNPDGSVAQLELAKSSGFARLDQSALDTVLSSWKFHPGMQDGKPVAAWVIVPIEFTLRS